MSPRRPLPPDTDPTLPLNRSEWVYMASDGPMGQLNQSYLMRFGAPFDAATAKAAFRALLVAYPRLRGIIVLTARRYRLRIPPVDASLDILIDQMFHEDRVDLDDPEAVRRWQEVSMNEPMALQRGLGARMQFVAHPQQPALLFTVHHVLADGRSMVLFVESLIKRLNGLPVEALPLDNPSMLPAVLPRRWIDWPGRLWSAWSTERAQARERARYEIVSLPSQRSTHYLTCGVQRHDLGLATKDLSRAGKARGGSGNSLLMAAFGTALLELAGSRPGTAALIRMSVDLRRYFPQGQAPTVGNYVYVLDVLLPQEVPEADRVKWIDAKVRDGQKRFEDRDMILPLLPYEMLGWLRPHDYTRLLLRAKRMDMLPRLSVHTTNIGSVDAFNPEGAGIALAELCPVVPGSAPLVVFVSVNGRQMVMSSNQRDEFADTDITRLLAQVRSVLQRWVGTGTA